MNLSYKEKSLWVSLLTVLYVFGHYFTHAYQVLKSPQVEDSATIRMFIWAIAILVIIHAICHGILASMFKKESEQKDDERDKLIELKATRVSYFILVFGVWVAGLNSILLDSISLIFTLHILLFFLVLAEIVGFALQLVYYRRGV